MRPRCQILTSVHVTVVLTAPSQRLWMMLRNRQLAEDFSVVVDGDVVVASSLSL